MVRVALLLTLVSLILTMGAVAQDQPPEGPFKTVHLVTLDAAQEAKLTGTLAQFNAAIAKAGYPVPASHQTARSRTHVCRRARREAPHDGSASHRHSSLDPLPLRSSCD
jgi:hypothetical protein